MGRKAIVTGRTLLDDFAAHLTHKLDAGTAGIVTMEPGRWYRELIDLLAGQGHRGQVYYAHLVSGALAAADRSPEETATAYFTMVLERRLLLAAGEEMHLGHKLLRRLCRRGVERGWSAAEMRRSKGAVAAASRFAEPRDFPDVAAALAAIDPTTSKGSAAPNTIKAKGPLWLTVEDEHAANVPEEISIWQAIVASPRKQRASATKAEFDEVCSLMINALDTANKHYGFLVRLGLPPIDWASELTTNTLRQLSKFKTAVMEVSGGEMNDRPAWEAAWNRVDIPGADTLDEFWSSPVGKAMRMAEIARRTAGSEGEGETIAGDDVEGALLDHASFAGLLNEASLDGVLNTVEVWIMQQVKLGRELAELQKDLRVVSLVSERGLSIEEFVDELAERLQAWAQDHFEQA